MKQRTLKLIKKKRTEKRRNLCHFELKKTISMRRLSSTPICDEDKIE